MAAKRIQSKLFAKQQAGTPTPAATSSSGSGSPAAAGSSSKPEMGELGPLQQVRDSFSAESGPNTIQKEGTSLKIDIPKPPTDLPGTQKPREKEQFPKKGSVPEDKSATGTPAEQSPAPGGSTAPPTADKKQQPLRERLLNSLGNRYTSVEEWRLDQDAKKAAHWKRWGPYLAERQWATVREDYSADGDAWRHFPHEHARSRAYRWGEDGIGGISDNHGRVNFALALWNGKDPYLKERLFGVTGHQGNHGEDVKELYYYLDSTPTHSYMKFLYKYPQGAYPYEELVRENAERDREVLEYEILDGDSFDDGRYWDVFVEYAKDEDDPEAVSIRITAYNRGPDPADLHIIPQLWFRNTWSWPLVEPERPRLSQPQDGVIKVEHQEMATTHLYCTPSPAPAAPAGGGVVLVDGPSVVPELLFTENDTNFERLYGGKNKVPFVKDAFHDHIVKSHRPAEPEDVPNLSALSMKSPPSKTPKLPPSYKRAEVDANGNPIEDDEDLDHQDGPEQRPEPAPRPTNARGGRQFVNPEKTGTKSGAHYSFTDVPARGGCVVVRLKMTPKGVEEDEAIEDEEVFDDAVDDRRTDADEFYARLASGPISEDLRNVMRQALGGMLWTKQFYMFIQKEWIEGDPGQPPPPPERKWVRNREWKHLHCADILSMPDKWEYPWVAAWDTAFHCIPLAMVDPAFAKKQLDLLTREWYMKPDGALPAYEWNFSDVNPPVHAWATFRIFKIERKLFGREDLDFLERVFQKLLINFTWWVNRKDSGGNNVFEGGFLGLDNIGPFNRSEPLPTGGNLRQADGTAWMAFYSLNMLNMALELAKHNPTYEDIASKFFEHFLFISDAMTFEGPLDSSLSLWNEEDGFYYDAISWGSGHSQQIPVHSLVGLIPLYATLTLEPATIKRFPGFKKRMDWFLENRVEMSQRNIANIKVPGKADRRLLSLVDKDRLVRILERMLDETEFLSEYGIRSLSLYHEKNPWEMDVNGEKFCIGYWPGDSKSGMFGGNSNWRGPIWLAVNFLLIESLQRQYQFYGDSLMVECPKGSGDYMNLSSVAEEIQHRLIHIFAKDEEGNRAYNGGNQMLNHDPHFKDYLQFFEFFNGNDGRGLGASHQTGWTGLVAYMIMQSGLSCRVPKTPRTPRSTAQHFFGEDIATPSERGDESAGPFSAYAASEATLGDLSPDAL